MSGGYHVRDATPLILVVDDDKISRNHLRRVLEDTGAYEVVTAQDGLEALKLVRARRPSVIVSDLTMPKLDGRKLVAAIKGSAETHHIQFIMLTALGGVAHAVDGLGAGADDYVVKPFDDGVLVARVGAAVRVANVYEQLRRRSEQLERARQELELEIAQRQRMEAELRLANKLEAIGQLAAGVAHEINTPAQYVGDNVLFLTSALKDLIAFFGEQSLELLGAGSPETLHRMAERSRALEIDYLLEEMPRALSQASEGIAQIARIVSAMKDFAHPGGADKVAVDLNHLIENTVTISRNQWKDVAEVVLELDPRLELVECLEGEIKQVVLNLLTNAAHAIADKQAQTGNSEKGRIVIGTQAHNGAVHLIVTDNGCGIPPRDAERIFDPFFTTKEVGRGTGQGLPIARSVVVERHQGRMTFATQLGVGTTFHVWLPFHAGDRCDGIGIAVAS